MNDAPVGQGSVRTDTPRGAPKNRRRRSPHDSQKKRFNTYESQCRAASNADFFGARFFQMQFAFRIGKIFALRMPSAEHSRSNRSQRTILMAWDCLLFSEISCRDARLKGSSAFLQLRKDKPRLVAAKRGSGFGGTDPPQPSDSMEGRKPVELSKEKIAFRQLLQTQISLPPILPPNRHFIAPAK